MKLDCKETKILLNAYIDLELSNEEIKLVETHIKACTHCKQDLDALMTISQSIKEMPGAPVHPELAHQLKVRVAQESHAFFRKVSPGDLLTFTFLRQAGLVFILILLTIYISFEVFMGDTINFRQTSQKDPDVIWVIPSSGNAQSNKMPQDKIKKSDDRISPQATTTNQDNNNLRNAEKAEKQNLPQNKSKKSVPPDTAIKIASLPERENSLPFSQETTRPVNQERSAEKPSDSIRKKAESIPAESNPASENPDTPKIVSSANTVISQPIAEAPNAQNDKEAKSNEIDTELLKLLTDSSIADKLKDATPPSPIIAKNIITIPIKFSYNLEKPILIIARLKFNGEKALTNIEFLSKMKDVNMRISLIRSLQNYDWKEFLIRNNLTGTTYKMDFILAKDGIILKNMPEKIIYMREKPLGLNS